MAAAYAARGMSCMNAVDTNVYVYPLEADEPAKQVMPADPAGDALHLALAS